MGMLKSKSSVSPPLKTALSTALSNPMNTAMSNTMSKTYSTMTKTTSNVGPDSRLSHRKELVKLLDKSTAWERESVVGNAIYLP